MATFDSAQYARRPTFVSTPATALRPWEIYGKRRTAYALFAANAYTWAQNDLGNCFLLPLGAHLETLTLRYGAFGASVTLDVGWTGSEAAIIAALDISAAGTTQAIPLNWGTPLTANRIIQVKFEGANPADTVALEVGIGFSVE